VAAHNHTVLVVDDHQDVRMALEALLVSEGSEVVTACEGGEALEQLRGGVDPCLILLDLMMPKVDGFQFRQEQLADPTLASIPVIVLSAYVPACLSADDRALTQRARLDAAAVLGKPVDPDELIRLVRNHCANAVRSARA
jgi:two-component system response regulator MprA